MKALLITLVILGAIVFLVIGVDVKYSDEGLALSARIGPLKIKLLPREERAKKPKPVKKKKEKEQAEKKPVDKELIKSIIPLGLDALGRLRRKLSIDMLALHFKAGNGDPYDTVLQYGRVTAALSVLLPALETAVTIRDRDIRTSFDFESEKPYIMVHIIATLAIWELIYIAFHFGIGFIKLSRRLKRESAPETDEAQSEAGQA